jgi:hypothetical protein
LCLADRQIADAKQSGRTGFSEGQPVGWLSDLEDCFDLDCEACRQRCHPDRGSRVAPLFAEDAQEELRTSIDHLRMISELGYPSFSC